MKMWLCVALFPLLALGCRADGVSDEAIKTSAVVEVVESPESSAEPVAVVQEQRNPVVLAAAGSVSAEILERVKNWGESQLAIPVPVVESLDVKGDSFEEVAEAAAKRLDAEDLGIVVLLLSEKPLPNHGVYRPDLRVVVVNVNLMQKDADDETFGRRMERQVIRGIGTLMGLELSPNPQSAMAMYSSIEELDQIGRNLDPPWLLRLQNRAVELGIPLDPDNPYNMLRE